MQRVFAYAQALCLGALAKRSGTANYSYGGTVVSKLLKHTVNIKQMIKTIFFLFCISMLPVDLISQEMIKQKCYKKITGECLPKLEILKNSDGTYVIKEYNKDGSHKMIANSTKPDPDYLDGYVKFFSEEGVIESEGTYKKNSICCDWKIYNDKGELEREISYNISNDKVATSLVFPEKENLDSTYEEMPKFSKGGKEEFRNYVSRELFYPPLSAKNGIEGRVFIQFSIDKYGNVVKVKVVKGTDKDLDKEALRVIRNCPKWNPGYKEGEPVEVDFTFPIVFILN